MSNSAIHISIANLTLLSIPLIVVLFFYMRWALSYQTILYATFRMVLQLILVGYALIFIFNQSEPLISSLILLFMLAISAWIALRPIKQYRKQYYSRVFIALFIGCVPTLALVIGGVVRLDPWYMPRYLIPLAGMVFANGMNSLSLCAERFQREISQGKEYTQARSEAYQTALLPLLNSFFAVGLVAIPGMMTGQILSGVSPLLAVRYQIFGKKLAICI